MRLTDRWRRKSKIEADVDARIAEVETQSGEATSEKDCTIESVWPLMRQAFYKRKNEVEPLRKSMADFRGKKGYFLSGGKIIRQFNFTDKSISDDTQDIAEREIDDDVRESKEPIKVQYRRERQKLQADVIEAVMFDMAKHIFGPDAEIVIPNIFDDRQNSLDLLVLFRDTQGTVEQVLGLDFTSASEQIYVDKKVIQALRSVIRGKLSTAKYIAAKNPQGGAEYFSANGIARAIIGISAASALLMAKGWLSAGKGNVPDLLGPERRKAMLYAVLEQYRAQLIISREKDRSEGLTQPTLATLELQREYDRIIEILYSTGLSEDTVRQKTDRTFNRIRETVRSIRRVREELYPRAVQIQSELNEKFAREQSGKRRL